jgi:predicted nucleic acid-binding protein
VSSFGVVTDACVLYPMALCDTLLRAAEKGLYRLFWSDLILGEVHRNLLKNSRITLEQADWRLAQMREAFPDAAVTGFERLIPVMPNDEKDRHVLAAAVAAGAQVIVTSNLRDFPAAALDPFGIEAQSPDEFLLHLLDLSPAQMGQILREQAARLKPRPDRPDPLGYVLDNLALQGPGFVERMRRLLRA